MGRQTSASQLPVTGSESSGAAWLAHRYDPEHDAVHLLHVPRAVHREVVFLTDDYLPANLQSVVVRRSDAVAAAPVTAPVHFIFHSAYCCSTMVTRAFDIPGWAMGLKEPVILNDIVGWRRRGGEGPDMACVLEDTLTLLARPFSSGEAIIVKPSNIVNALASAILTLRPDAHALLLHTPLRNYLGSIAKKGMDGRLWARTLLMGLIDDRLVNLGYSARDYLGQTDLQVAAIGWLAQHALFTQLIKQFGGNRLRSLDSETLILNPANAMTELSAWFGLPMDRQRLDQIIDGPAFNSHSKVGTAFGSGDRILEHQRAADTYVEEIEKVAQWAEVVAATFDIPINLPAPLLDRTAP
jgi:hypothetical protein